MGERAKSWKLLCESPLSKSRRSQMRLLKEITFFAVPLITLTVASQALYYPRLNLRHWETLLLPTKILP